MATIPDRQQRKGHAQRRNRPGQVRRRHRFRRYCHCLRDDQPRAISQGHSVRKVIGAFFQSPDGVMQAPGGPEEDPSGGFEFGGWTQPFWDESANEPMGKLFDAAYDLLLGKRTYDIFAAYWPYNQDVPI